MRYISSPTSIETAPERIAFCSFKFGVLPPAPEARGSAEVPGEVPGDPWVVEIPRALWLPDPVRILFCRSDRRAPPRSNPEDLDGVRLAPLDLSSRLRAELTTTAGAEHVGRRCPSSSAVDSKTFVRGGVGPAAGVKARQRILVLPMSRSTGRHHRRRVRPGECRAAPLALLPELRFVADIRRSRL